MNSLRSRPWPVAALALALLSVPAVSYAAARPHTRDDLVAHARAVGQATRFPTTGLAVGEPPTIPYAFASEPEFGEGNWQLRRPDGSTLKLPRLTWSAWAPMGDGALGMAGTEAGPQLQQVSGTGEVAARTVQHFGIEVSPDHEIAGWLGDHGRTHVVEGGGTRHLTMPRVAHGTKLSAIWGDTTCQEQDPEGGGCTVFVQRHGHVWIATSHGIVTHVGPMLKVTDISRRGHVIGLVSRRTAAQRACWGVFGTSGHRAFRTCDYYLDAFSPDGHQVLAERSQSQWWSVRHFAVLAGDGHVVRAWTFDPGRHRSLSQLTWEDSDHLLGVLMTHGQWGLVRIGTDGSVGYAGPTVPVTDEFTPFNLPVR
jgi:hypothetical protein